MKQLKLFGISLGTYTQKRIMHDNDNIFIVFYGFSISDNILYGKINTENIMFMTKTKLSKDEINILKKQWKEEQDRNNNKVVLLTNDEVTYRYNHINENEFFIDTTLREIFIDNRNIKCCLEVNFKDLHNDIILSLINQKNKQYLFKSRLEIFAKSLNVYWE